MYIYLMSWIWRGQPIISVFSHRYVRRWNRYRRKYVFSAGEATMEDLTAEEVGQLLGGN